MPTPGGRGRHTSGSAYYADVGGHPLQDSTVYPELIESEIHLPFNICLGITLLVLLVRTLLKGPVKAAAVTLLSIMWILERIALLIMGVGRECAKVVLVSAPSHAVDIPCTRSR
ncbi:hypothetical protein B0H14DRAFT_2613083 [Mycena olivaceomarginata]|nr:hypothetical protein B0H14DRAFT_2613083 [Mycena olivaceomarginata]